MFSLQPDFCRFRGLQGGKKRATGNNTQGDENGPKKRSIWRPWYNYILFHIYNIKTFISFVGAGGMIAGPGLVPVALKNDLAIFAQIIRVERDIFFVFAGFRCTRGIHQKALMFAGSNRVTSTVN